MTHQIVIREIIPPRPGGKQHSLIDTSGQRWGVYSDHVNDYQVGGIYNVIRSKESTFQGKQYITLDEAEFVGMDQGAAAPPPPRQAAPPPRQAYAPRGPAAPRPNGGYQPRASSGDDPKRSMHIFICGAFNNILSNPNINPAEMNTPQFIAILGNLATAYRQTLGKDMTAQGDMNDEIPF